MSTFARSESGPAAATPSITGIRTSRHTTSGWTSRATSIACRPSPASPTTWIPSASASSDAIPRRTIALSSTSKTRITAK
jgi:hypothetical protein